MNEFFNSIINLFRGVRTSVTANPYTSSVRTYTFGSIVSGSYNNWRKDPTPTILVLWSDFNYTHGINIHYLNNSEQVRLLRTIYLMFKGQQVLNPRLLYQYLKMNFKSTIDKAYRMYKTPLCNYKLISPGFSMLPMDYCYPITDRRDGVIGLLNRQMAPIPNSNMEVQKIAYSQEELQKHIAESLNTRKIL